MGLAAGTHAAGYFAESAIFRFVLPLINVKSDGQKEGSGAGSSVGSGGVPQRGAGGRLESDGASSVGGMLVGASGGRGSGGLFGAGGVSAATGGSNVGVGGALPGSGGSASGGTATGGRASGGSASGGSPSGGSGSGGSPSDPDAYLDAEGDAPIPGLDVLEAHVYIGDRWPVFRIRTADQLEDGARVEFDLGYPGGGLFLERRGDGYRVQWLWDELTLGWDAPQVLSVDEDTFEVQVVARGLPSSDLEDEEFRLYSSKTGLGEDFLGEDGPYVSVEDEVAPAGSHLPLTDAAEWSWGLNESSVPLSSVALGEDFGCALTDMEQIVCWGEEADAWVVPTGAFDQVVTSDWIREQRRYACGLRPSGDVECWGDDPPALDGTFVSLGEPAGCGVDDDAVIRCFEVGGGGDQLISASGNYQKVVGVGTNVLMLRGGDVSLINDFLGVDPVVYEDIVLTGEGKACALFDGGTLQCFNHRSPDLVGVTAMAGRAYHSHYNAANNRSNYAVGCALHSLGTTCWGYGYVPPVPATPFVDIDMNDTGEVFCGTRVDGTLLCWAYPVETWHADPSAAAFPP